MQKEFFRILFLSMMLLYTSLMSYSAGSGGSYADKSYYMVDSLVLEDLSEDDKLRLDVAMKAYHIAKNDTLRLKQLSQFINECGHEGTRIKYNKLMGKIAKDLLLSEPQNSKESKKYQVYMAASLDNLGILYDDRGDYPTALRFYLESLQIKREIGEQEGIGRTLGNIGIVYRNQGEFDKALGYYDQALTIHEEVGDENSVSSSFTNIAIIYSIRGVWPKALDNYFKALDICKRLNDKDGLSNNLGNIATVYRMQGEMDLAMKYYLEALQIQREIGDQVSVAINLANYGSLLMKVKRYSEAEEYLERALALSDSIKTLSTTEQIELMFTGLYEETDRFQLALEHYKRYTVAKDSLFNEEKSKEIGKLEAKHEFETAEGERKRFEQERQKQEEEAKVRRDNLQYSGILIFLVLVFAGIFALGRIKIPARLAEGLIFFSFLLFFEFTLVLLDPYIEQYSSGAPAIKLGFNALLAGLIFPLHSFFESRMKEKLVS